MRQFMLVAIFVVGSVMDFSTASAQQSFCIHGRGCVPVTPASYNSCFNLALARGESAAWGERKRLDWFIYQCLAGRIPR